MITSKNAVERDCSGEWIRTLQFYFVRHGESEANLRSVFANRGSEHPLTAKGREQALSLAIELADLKIAKLYSSPLRRAIQTTEILSGALSAPYEIIDALREYDCGVLEGTGDRAGWETYRRVLNSWERGEWDERIQGGESYNDLRARFIPFMEDLIAQFGQQSGAIILVAHGGLYRCMLPMIMSNVDIHFTMANPISNASYVVSDVADNKLTCLEWCGQKLG
jgi:probable phosphoglycerate mutase